MSTVLSVGLGDGWVCTLDLEPPKAQWSPGSEEQGPQRPSWWWQQGLVRDLEGKLNLKVRSESGVLPTFHPSRADSPCRGVTLRRVGAGLGGRASHLLPRPMVSVPVLQSCKCGVGQILIRPSRARWGLTRIRSCKYPYTCWGAEADSASQGQWVPHSGAQVGDVFGEGRCLG